ncbi:MAG: energy transducer TonB [Myxococcus sp.]|nr:energy transducer TonB [Myxococcus sp.]
MTLRAGGRLFVSSLCAGAVAAAAIPPGSMTVLAKTLTYDEGLSARLVREPVTVFALGLDCAAWPAGTRIANHGTSCQAAEVGPGLVREAATRGGVLLLGEVDVSQGLALVAQAREAQVPVLGLGAAFASTDVLLAVDGSRTFIGEQAAKRLGARFPTSVLKLATIMRGEAADEAPKVSEFPSGGEYPEEARQADVEGVVKLALTVDADGRVTAARVLKGLGYGLDEEALRRARRIRFSPGRRNGQPVASSLEFNLRFTLQDE